VSIYVVWALFAPSEVSSDSGTPIATNSDEGPLDISPKGPWPKAVVDSTEFMFGRMEVGEKRSREFAIRNDGQAPLLLRKGGSTCQCTLSALEKGELAVGESAKVTLTWQPTSQAENFLKSADVRTNDPDHKTITLQLKGMVVPRVLTNPSGKDWSVSNVADDHPTVFKGLILSPLVEKFEILSLESDSPLISVEALPLSKERLDAQTALSGYEIRVTISPEVPVGPFAFPLTIRTDIPDRNKEGEIEGQTSVDVLVSGVRRGPIRILGREWTEERMAISLGQFTSAEGKTATLMMLVRGAPEEGFRVTEGPVCDPKELKATIEADEKSTAKQARLRLKLEYPAGGPRVRRGEDKPATIRFRTNHPYAPEVELRVYLTAS